MTRRGVNLGTASVAGVFSKMRSWLVLTTFTEFLYDTESIAAGVSNRASALCFSG